MKLLEVLNKIKLLNKFLNLMLIGVGDMLVYK